MILILLVCSFVIILRIGFFFKLFVFGLKVMFRMVILFVLVFLIIFIVVLICLLFDGISELINGILMFNVFVRWVMVWIFFGR